MTFDVFDILGNCEILGKKYVINVSISLEHLGKTTTVSCI